MTRKPKAKKTLRARAKTRRHISRTSPRRATAGKTAKPDQLDEFIASAAKALDLPTRKAWLPAIKANLRVTLQLAATVTSFELPDDAEPAPVFKA